MTEHERMEHNEEVWRDWQKQLEKDEKAKQKAKEKRKAAAAKKKVELATPGRVTRQQTRTHTAATNQPLAGGDSVPAEGQALLENPEVVDAAAARAAAEFQVSIDMRDRKNEANKVKSNKQRSNTITSDDDRLLDGESPTSPAPRNSGGVSPALSDIPDPAGGVRQGPLVTPVMTPAPPIPQQLQDNIMYSSDDNALLVEISDSEMADLHIEQEPAPADTGSNNRRKNGKESDRKQGEK